MTGLFETMRCYKGYVFMLEKHLNRLVSGCAVLGFEAPSRSFLKKAVQAVLEKSKVKNFVLRLDVWKEKNKVSFVAYPRSLDVYGVLGHKKNATIALYSDKKLKTSTLNNVKLLDRSFYQQLIDRSRADGFDEAIFLNSRKHVVEGARTNIFMVKKRVVLTPSIGCGCLPGVTRDIVIKLLKKLKVSIKECEITPKELMCADEIFLTNSIREILPVSQLDKKIVGKGIPGPLTRKLKVLYQKEVERYCKKR